MTTGEKISHIRKTKGISQELLAERSNLSLRTVQRIEGGTTTPRPYTLKTLADTLGVPVEQLASDAQLPPVNDDTGLQKLKQLNVVALSILIAPFLHVALLVWTWRRNRPIGLPDIAARKIISFHLLWSIATIVLVFLVPVIQYALIKSYVIGHLPPTVWMVYGTLLILNLGSVIHTAVKLQKENVNVYNSIPALF